MQMIQSLGKFAVANLQFFSSRVVFHFTAEFQPITIWMCNVSVSGFDEVNEQCYEFNEQENKFVLRDDENANGSRF